MSDLSKAARDVLEERARQVRPSWQGGEGWNTDHDDDHAPGDLAEAGACYALYAYRDKPRPPASWPWEAEWWKQKDARRDLVRAAALIIAEIERYDRGEGSDA